MIAALRRHAGRHAQPVPGPTIRRVWAYRPDMGRQNAERDAFLWYGNAAQKPARVPGLATRFRLTEAPTRAASPADEQRLEREGVVSGLYSTAAYSALRGATGGRAPSSLNPFGRFNTDLTSYGYLPFDGSVPQPISVSDAPGRVAIQARSRDLVEAGPGIAVPSRVVDYDGVELVPIAVDPFGVTYGLAAEAPALPRARGQAGQSGQRAALPPAAARILEPLHGAPAAVRADVDRDRVHAFRGGRASEDSQKTVMGASANDVAAAAGLTAVDEHYDPADVGAQRKHGFEWLHLVAYHLGGGPSGPQVPENLVVGTTAANTWMIMIENLLSAVVEDGTATSMQVHVFPSWHDEHLRIAQTINYLVQFRLPDGRRTEHNLSFDALTTHTPFEATHRHFREELYRRLQPGTPPPPMSEEAEAMYD